jgi:predicted XRE-type DNA-binding protein
MFYISEPDELGLTRDDILRYAGPQPWTKDTLFVAASLAMGVRLAARVFEVLTTAYDGYVMVNGSLRNSSPQSWHEGLLAALSNVVDQRYRTHLEDAMPDPDNTTKGHVEHAATIIASWMANGIRTSYSGSQGRFLAKFGIVAADYAPAEPEPVADAEPRATREEVSLAWQQFGQATAVEQADLAKTLGISRSTISNYQAGKTAAKCNADQAAILEVECTSRANLLLAAAATFRRVK